MLTKRLKEARLRAGLSQEKLGILAGIDEASASARMNQYEKGKHTPDFEMACKLAKVLDIPESYLYTKDDLMAEMMLKFYHLSNKNRIEIMNVISNNDQ
ncbi:helix-turn-helix transcriptional regulator [Yersinia enterocolitica]|uniref:DNA-binding protein n=1 Tax=Yersinia aldovae TaxID=29483 RepID=A0ABM9SSB1_YERAL|nr:MULTISPECIES: helix-turn-helix transcriptional regulator [Yersinia]EKN3967310.1 helix-turn-helix transcriptional regulator [Yersinia enterocolitica]ELI8020178.1 helix-turn-helix transcriptional regulator [Yersinia enterocolitica]ELW8197275.1 helix-turn-helix transcriptional regulator [Yersinia enterocolitica]CNJ23744.1 putative DNA-binding protein [Yersinia aldovae]CNK60384.1 putative DNA-binding protein [Yersinia frederiksenii]